MHLRKLFIVLGALLVLASPLLARIDNASMKAAPQSSNRLLTEETEKTAWFWMIWWAGVGDLSDVCISNTLQGGLFHRAAEDEHAFRGLPPSNASISTSGYGDQMEYPAGSEQWYNFAWGLWVGSQYPAKIASGDTTWEPNVSKGGFYTDFGAMAAVEMEDAGGMYDISNRGIYFSDMEIPEGYGFQGAGGQLFAQSGQTPLDYQTIWPFADTSINKRRRTISMPEVFPENGDVISQQDSYACGGDWIPAKDAAILWIRPTGPYDVWGQGLRIEQRTYSWNYDYNNSYVFINYKIRNMNDFPLKEVYFSFFMDNDISGGSGGSSPGDDGFWDDLIGFDQGLNLGYTYDANGSEEGWVTPAGYIGAVLLETPNDIGLTGFETWQNGHDIDNDGEDDLKYERMKSTDFVTWESPNDVRMLLNCGPYTILQPHEEVDVTLAIIVAYSLDELKEKTKAAKIQFENGYFGYAPPPNPSLTLIPGDSVVYVHWGSEPERYIDPMGGQATFEGYRLYRSLSGLTDTWELLADYDLKGSSTSDSAVVEHSSGPSKATIEFVGFYENPGLISPPESYGFRDNVYTVSFQRLANETDSNYYIIYDADKQQDLPYNADAFTEGGFCILASKNAAAPLALPGAVAATGAVTFTGPEGTFLKKGVVVATDPDTPIFGYVEYKTTDSITIDVSGTVDMEVEAVIAGKDGNILANQITTIIKPDLPGVTVTNNESITGGKDGMAYYPYHSGDIIFIDGAQYMIKDGDSATALPGDILEPGYPDIFKISTYQGEEVGGQAGVRHYYIDENVDNGQLYYYTVTSYSRPQPTEGIGSLESGKTGKTYWAVPRSNPLGWQEASVGPVIRIGGTGSAMVRDSLISPDEVTGHEYEVGFRADSTGAVRLAYFEDVDADSMVLDSFITKKGELSGPIIDGVLVMVASVSVDTLDAETLIDTIQTGWLERPSGTEMSWEVDWPGDPQPLPIVEDFLVTVIEKGKDNSPTPRTCPIKIENYETGTAAEFIWGQTKDSTNIKNDYKAIIYWPEVSAANNAFTLVFKDTLLLEVADTFKTGDVIDSIVKDTIRESKPPKPGDKFLIKSLKATTVDDKFRYTTIAARINADDTNRTLDDIRVVPNPYYVRAAWDRSKYARGVYFQNLPLKCTIRIFNSAGLLIKTIEHNGEGLLGSAGSELWNLSTEEDLDCTSGLYIWQVQTESADGKKQTKVGKFAIVR